MNQLLSSTNLIMWSGLHQHILLEFLTTL